MPNGWKFISVFSGLTILLVAPNPVRCVLMGAMIDFDAPSGLAAEKTGIELRSNLLGALWLYLGELARVPLVLRAAVTMIGAIIVCAWVGKPHLGRGGWWRLMFEPQTMRRGYILISSWKEQLGLSFRWNRAGAGTFVAFVC